MITLTSLSTRLALLAVLTAPFASQAQEGEPRSNGWGIGLGVAVRDTLYAGEDNRIQPFPLITYQGEHLYLEGTSVGYRVIDTETFTVSGFVAARLDGIETEDFDRRALAARGIDRYLLEDRDLAADVGVSAVLKTGSAGEFQLDLRGDATDTSDGYQASLDYRYPFQAGPVRLIPSVGAVAMSDELVNYYYGTLPKEVARGVVDYRPGSAIVVRGGLTAIVPSGPRWIWLASLSADAYPDEITDSPLVDADTDIVPSVFIGVIRNF
jgi:MipA family protein